MISKPRNLLASLIVVFFLQLNSSFVSFTAAQGTDIVIAQNTSLQNEISLAIIPGTVPGSPSLLLAAYNDDPVVLTGLGVSTSIDGGANWSNSQLPIPVGMANAFDPTARRSGLPHWHWFYVSVTGYGVSKSSGGLPMNLLTSIGAH